MAPTGRPFAPLTAILLALAVTAGALASPVTPAAASREGRWEVFSGPIDAFYEVPDPLPRGDRGDLIRVQPLSRTPDEVSLRVMYHSRDAQGRDRAVTGVFTYPTGKAPRKGWPVISTAHGTTGMASPCAPSRTVTSAPAWGVEGVRVMTDYIGLGPVGELHPYLSKPSEGHAVIDAVRAVRQIREAHAGRRWVSIGHSQGGHGALAAAELAKRYAPGLKLVGTVALSPAAMFDRVYGGVDPIVTAVLTTMGLYGGATEHPEIDVADYLTPAVLQAGSAIRTGCLTEISAALAPVAAAGAFTADPRHTEPARSVILANDVGSVAVKRAPLFLASGTRDDLVVIDRVRDLFARLCDAGQVTELVVGEGADHGSIIPLTAARVADFIEERFERRRPVDSCP